MSLDIITQQLKDKMAFAPHIKAKVLFDFGDDGVVFVDTNESPAEMSHDRPDEFDVSLICSKDTFEGILGGTQDPNIAFMMGKLKVKGSMGLAMKLNGVLED
jgi:putative sterol carrier protein